jgi:hypothetical protein
VKARNVPLLLASKFTKGGEFGYLRTVFPLWDTKLILITARRNLPHLGSNSLDTAQTGCVHRGGTDIDPSSQIYFALLVSGISIIDSNLVSAKSSLREGEWPKRIHLGKNQICSIPCVGIPSEFARLFL